MSESTFDPKNEATWPTTLLIEHVAAIRQMSRFTICRKATRGLFHPAPIRGGGYGQRWEWTRESVIAFERGETRPSRLRKVG